MAINTKKKAYYRWLVILLIIVTVVCAVFVLSRPAPTGKQSAENTPTTKANPDKKSQIPEKEVASGSVIKVGNSQYGQMLFDDRGQAIYIWQLEDSSTAKCYGDCAQEWPPVITNGVPVAASGVNGQLLGTTTRTDGTTQVTYNGHPLYYYANEQPGEVECHNIRTHGGLWWVIQPNGIRAK